jgi:hypothetical protein
MQRFPACRNESKVTDRKSNKTCKVWRVEISYSNPEQTQSLINEGKICIADFAVIFVACALYGWEYNDTVRFEVLGRPVK